MARKVDITEKLSFNEAPCLVIKGKELNLHDDAATVLKAVDIMSEGSGAKQVADVYELIFDETAKKELGDMKLNFKDFSCVVKEAAGLVLGGDDETGEEQTHTTA